MKTETCKLYSRDFRIFLPNIIKIDPYNFELYRFKVGPFFETQCRPITWHVCNYFTVKVSVSYFKVDKSENLDNSFYAFTFFDVTLKKRTKSRFLDFEKKTLKTYSPVTFTQKKWTIQRGRQWSNTMQTYSNLCGFFCEFNTASSSLTVSIWFSRPTLFVVSWSSFSCFVMKPSEITRFRWANSVSY